MSSAPDVATVTSLVYQPFAPSVPVGVRVTPVGAVLSSLTVRGAAFVVRPASFVQDPAKAVPFVSLV